MNILTATFTNSRALRRMAILSCWISGMVLKVLLLVFALTAGLHLQARAQQGHQQHGQLPNVLEYLDQLEKPERDQYQKPAQVVETLGLKSGMAVADLGSGSGYFTRRFVEAVTEKGKVYAIDVEPEALKYVRDSIEHMHIPYSAEFILARPDSPKLPFESVDLIFLCNVYHHLENRAKYFADVKSAFRAGGRIAVVDFYHDERSGDLGFPKDHLVPREAVLDEMGKAGYRLLREHTFLSKQYFLEFVPVDRGNGEAYITLAPPTVLVEGRMELSPPAIQFSSDGRFYSAWFVRDDQGTRVQLARLPGEESTPSTTVQVNPPSLGPNALHQAPALVLSAGDHRARHRQ